ncbi:MAG: chemotaxis protein CheA [Gammaproteobacteria bacterium]
MSIDITQFHATFFEESFEGLEIMETSLLALEVGSVDENEINCIFRAAHSIKGGSATFGFTAVAEFTHAVETLLDEMRNGHRNATQEIIQILLNSVDVLRELLTATRDGTDIDSNTVAEVQNKIEAILKENGNDASAPQTAAEPTATAAGKNGLVEWKISFRPHAHLMLNGNDPERIISELATLGDCQVVADKTKVPSFKELNPEECYLAWDITLHTDVAENEISEIFEWVEDDCDLEITATNIPKPEIINEQKAPEAISSEKAPAAAKPRAQKPSLAPESSSIRVSIDKVDALINMVGELVITQSMIGQLDCDYEDFDASRMEKLRDGLTLLERNTRELQESVMRIRMLPISFVFNRFPRMVHDLSIKLEKNIELKISGEQTELDKTVMEKIGDPLVHLIRNSLDHGIEKPDVRASKDKPETGTINLNAYHQGGNIVIEIKDDGAGLNKEKLLNKAINSGLIDKVEKLSDEAIYDLIFHPGLSTADTISDVSGRGVGMDVVRKNIKALGGNIEVNSTPDIGTTLTIRLPLTLAILDGQLVRVGNETYIISLIAIIESLQIHKRSLNTITGKAELYKVRDEYIPVVRLHDIFNIKPDNTNLEDGLLVVVEGGGHKVGLFVDELLGQQQVVIKSLESNFRRVEGVSGATILGDGTVALILDIDGLVNISKTNGSTPPSQEKAVA